MKQEEDVVTDGDETPGGPRRPVTAMSLRAEKLRRTMAQAAGAKQSSADPGLSPAAPPRDPELRNRWAKIGVAAGIVSVFLDPVIVVSVVAVVFCLLGLRQAKVLEGRGKGAYGRRRSHWGLGLAAFGAVQLAYRLIVQLYFR